MDANDRNDGQVPFLRNEDRLSPVCQRFEAELRDGDTPNIERYLDEALVSDRETLFCLLLNLEIDYKRHRNEPVEHQYYLTRFPAYSHVLREKFQRQRRVG